MSKLLLIDGNSIMNRGYFALPKTLTTRNGIHTNAILGFLNVFYKIYDEEKPDHIAVAFDVHEPTFRHKMYEAYKGTRHSMDDELREQFPIIKDVLTAMGITYVEKGGYEADDIIGTYSRQAVSDGMNVTILSGDRDLLQLATDKILVRIPKTKAGKTTIENYYDKDVEAEYGVTPIEFIEMKGLMGDTSDNIPGVQGIGPKTASAIIQKYHTIEAALEDIENIKPDKARKNLDAEREMALFSRDLATIKLDCDLEKNVNDMEVNEAVMYGSEAYELCKELELNSILKRFSGNENVQQKKSIELDIIDIGYSEIIDKIKKEYNKFKTNIVGFYPVVIDGQIQGGAVSIDSKVYIIQDTDVMNFVKDAEEWVEISINNIKDYINLLNIKEDSKVFDVAIAAYLVDPLASSYTYDRLGYTYLDQDIEDEKTILGKHDITIFSFFEQGFRKYLAYNAYVSYAVTDILKSKMEELGETSLYKDVEFPAIFVLRDMEDYGIRLDRETLVKYGDELDVQIKQLESEIVSLAGEEFNINSPKQLGVILFEKLQLKSGKKTKSGYSTSVEVLSKLKDEHPIIPKILEYRSLTKLKSTYVDGLTGTVRGDGRIHSTFNQTVTATGRLSSTEPNLQNIPARSALGREIRKAFIPADGYTFVDADYSQIELRVMAAISKDESLIEAFNESKDIHAITASQVFGVDLDDVTPDLRRKAKAVNFGIIYGISSFGLGEDLGISRKEAKEYIEKYFVTYPKIKSYLDESVEEAKKKGYVRTLMNRIRPIPELGSSNFMQRSFGERVAMNSPIQGTAADIIKLAMINVRKELKDRGLKSRLILQIHDELLIEAENSEIDIVCELLARNMENAVKLSVPMYVDVHTGDSLFEAK